ncbi:S-adenosylmethionine-dependent methyltransferase [Lecanicillium sp. MT-2017a]|nr:S-adenosylmethionine-dependent methyltransferase [Lecanicillium sp. MT-2017a]
MPKPQPHNPVQAAVTAWIASIPPPADQDAADWEAALLSSAPKRFTIYEPMALLPSGSFSNSTWAATLSRCDASARESLWSLLLQELTKVAKGPLTNLAINEGIPLQKDGAGEENILRSPSGLHMLHGDFGAGSTTDDQPTAEDFESAFWVSTKQNGIHQTWSPRWTMFSRGNVKEKARLLDFNRAHAGNRTSKGKEAEWAVDLYAGIGYFVFSYASLGFKVLGWELNPWSVEGLRRGAKANKWSIKVIRGDDLTLPLEQLMSGNEQIIIFQEDNQKAQQRLAQMQAELGEAEDIRHVNGGFLPTSEPTWRESWEMTQHSPQAWLHLHENVAVADIASRRGKIEDLFKQWSASEDSKREVFASHVEQVKTFAPGVWHCVFDVSITRL